MFKFVEHYSYSILALVWLSNFYLTLLPLILGLSWQSHYTILNNFLQLSSCDSVFSVYIGDDVPKLSKLNKYIVPKFSASWEKLGVALALDQYQVAIISKNHAHNPHRSEDCCREMLIKWLQINPSATWGVLEDAVTAIMSPSDPVVYNCAGSYTCLVTVPISI